MASELHVDAIKHSGGTSAMTISSSGSVNIAGHVVQTLSEVLRNRTTSTSSSYTTVLTLNITPKFSTSKLLISGYFSGSASNNAHVMIFRDSTALITTNDSRTPSIRDFYEDQWDGQIHVAPFQMFESANNTNATAFTMKVKTTGTLYMNTPRDTSDSSGRSIGQSVLTVQEIGQ
jgi:hypothetical protein